MPKALPASTKATILFPGESEEEKQERRDHVSLVLEGPDVWNSIQTLAPLPRKALGSEVVEFDNASYIIEQATLQAEGMILRAEMDAEAIIEDANTEAGRIRSESHKTGLSQGLAQARTDVETELTAKFEIRVSDLNASVDAIVNSFASEREALWKSMEEDIVSLALDIAKKVTKLEIDSNKDLVIAVITDALKRVSDRSNLRILVNPNEVAHVRGNREDLMMSLDGIKSLEIDPDRRIGPGGCVIETNAGSVDAKIETQFEQVETTLLS